MAELIVATLALLLLEIILGVDNVIFVSILSDKLPLEKQRRARNLGMGLAMLMRLVLLFCVGWIISLEQPIDWLWGMSGKGIVLIVGGFFLGYSSVKEIHEASKKGNHKSEKNVKSVSFAKTILSIVGVSLIFSIDSILTAVGITESIAVMAIGIIGSTIIMMMFAKKISDYIKSIYHLRC
jgi:predicted tellurium resistance membrane protein TerC